jgi:hypothetical protein
LKQPILFWLSLCAILLGCRQSLTGQSLEFVMRQGMENPWQSTRYPESQTVRVEDQGHWSAQVAGDLANGCNGPCMELKPASGNGPQDASVSFLSRGAEILPAGVHTGTIQVGSQLWNIKLTVYRRQPYLPFYYPDGYPKGCYQSQTQFSFSDTCQISKEQPAENSEDLRTAGTSVIDSQFGHSITRLTGPTYNVSYSTMRAFSATAKYILTSDLQGFLQVWDRANNRKQGNSFAGLNIGTTVWDPQDDEILWGANDSQIIKRNIRTGQTSVMADYRNGTNRRPPFAKLDTGNTSDNTDDNWWVFTEIEQKLVCAIDLNNLTRANQEDHIYCATYAPLNLTNIDFPQVTQVDSESGKRYVLLLGEPRAQVFSVNVAEKKLDYEYPTPVEIKTPHSDVGQDSQGRQVLFWTWYDAYGDMPYAATSYLNRGAKMNRPVEEPGGGLRLLYPLYGGRQATDVHFGCNWSGYCVLSSYRASVPGGIPVLAIADVQTTGANCVIKTTNAHTFADGSSVAIGGTSEMTGVNGVSPIHVIDSRTLQLDHPCQGRYTNRVGHIAAAQQYSVLSPNRDEVVVIRLDAEIRRVAIHRTKLFANQGDIASYWATPRASLSRDGKFVAYASNLGLPEPTSVFWAEINDQGKQIRAATVEPQDVVAELTWDGPEEVVILVSKEPDMVEWAYSYEHRTGDPTRHHIDGLEPSQLYYMELIGQQSALFQEFHTTPPAMP